MREHEEEMVERMKIERKKAAIKDAEYRRDEPVDDSKLVDAMFDFLPKTDSSAEAPAPTAFKVKFRFINIIVVYTFPNVYLLACRIWSHRGRRR